MRKILFLLFITSQIFSQNLQKEPVAIPAPFELQQNINLDYIIQPLAKSATVGDTTFFIRKNVRSSDVDLESVEFYKKFENDTLVVYSEVAEWENGNVTEQTITNVVNSLLYNTPSGSVDPHKGILTNEMELLGQIPDIDKNGKLFVLLIDVRDDYEAGTSTTYVAGYFDPIDQLKTKGNLSDIIYIDTNPANSTDEYTLSVVAHELQHLIHYNYDTNESTWLNEGFSELIPILLGYTSHSFSSFLSNTDRKLATFDGSILDYAKVGLWTYYIYNRFGIEAIQHVLKNSDNDLTSYIESLNELGFSVNSDELLRDWFIANMINDPTIGDGRYSYNSNEIPVIQSDYFHANFTEGNVIHGVVKPQSAQYIQFNSGKNINLSVDVEKHSLASMTVIKHTNPLTLQKIDISSGKYNLEDLTFGTDYKKLSLVLSWTSAMDASYELDFSYSAVGVGGYEENELFHDNDTLNYYLSLTVDNVAAEKFQVEKYSELSSIKFNCGTSSPVDLKVYSSLDKNPIQTFSDVSSNYQEWTVFNLPEVMAVNAGETFYISVQAAGSDAISMGYADTENNDANSYLKNGGQFYELDNFSTDGGDTRLDGNWLIRAIVRNEIFKEAEMVIEPDTLFLFESETLIIQNAGTEMLYWDIDSLSDWLSVSQYEGVMSEGKIDVDFSADLSDELPGIYHQNVSVNSNVNQDSVVIYALKQNSTAPQSAYILSSDKFDHSLISMRVFNIGQGSSSFEISDFPEFLAINPASGTINENDTVIVYLKIDSTMVTSNDFFFIFDNGQYEIEQSLTFHGNIADEAPDGLKIYNTYPNPFVLSKHTNMNILARLKSDKKAKIQIYNVLGELINEIEFADHSKGLHLLTWDGRTKHGTYAPSSVYILALEQGNQVKAQKVLLIK